MKRFFSLTGWRAFLLCFILGAIANFGHAPFYIWPVTIACLAVLTLIMDHTFTLTRRKRAGFWRAFAFALGYFAFGLFWIGSAFIARGPAYIPVMPFAILGLVSLLSVFWGLAGAVYARFTDANRPLRYFAFAALLFLAEVARGHLFGGLPWNLTGYVFKAGEPISQLASITGIYGLTVLVLMFGAALAFLIDGFSRSKLKASLPAVVSAVLFAGLFGFGTQRLNTGAPTYHPDVKLRIVHANIPQKEKMDYGNYDNIAYQYLTLSAAPGLEEISHVIWPEGALPGVMFGDENLVEAIYQVLSSAGPNTPVFIGQTQRQEILPGDDGLSYFNAVGAISFDNLGRPAFSDYYDKRRLVPGGEFIPGGPLAKKLGLKTVSTALEGFTPALNDDVPALPGLPPVSIQICYESIFPGFTPKVLSPSGEAPQWILNLSNDSWYGNSAGPRQHVNQVAYRAIEEGLPVIRSTSGGYSGSIDSNGRILQMVDMKTTKALDVHLPHIQVTSWFSAWFSGILVLINIIISLGCCAYRAR